MLAFPHKIISFLTSHHVLSLAACHDNTVWSANCFYVFDEDNGRLIILSSCQSRHSQLILLNPYVSGTIAGQPSSIQDIRGIQFTAKAECLKDAQDAQQALQRYAAIHPMAKLIPSSVWSLMLETIKYTDNQLFFAKKTHWQRM